MKTVKIGDTLHASIRIYDEFRKQPVVIDETVSFISNIKDATGNLLGVVNISLYDQIETSGWISLYVPSSVTQLWKEGRAYMDIKTIVDDKVIVSSDIIEFNIIPTITTTYAQGV